MPQQTHPFKHVVDLVKSYVEQVNPANKNRDCYVQMNHSLAQFTKQDFFAMATNPASAAIFEKLYELKVISEGRSPKPNAHLRDPLKNAADAKAALGELKPANIDLNGFLRLIEDVSTSTGVGRSRFMPQLQGKRFGAMAEDGAQLHQGGVTLDAEHALKKPLETAVAEVVKTLKGTGRNA